MRIPELFTFIAATGQLSGLSTLRKIVIVLFMNLYATDTRRLPFHIAGGDSEFSLASACDRSYRVRPGDICDSIAIQNRAPTLVSLYITFAHFTYSSKKQLPDHVRKRADRWQVQQS